MHLSALKSDLDLHVPVRVAEEAADGISEEE